MVFGYPLSLTPVRKTVKRFVILITTKGVVMLRVIGFVVTVGVITVGVLWYGGYVKGQGTVRD